jgi:hypothetical protein
MEARSGALLGLLPDQLTPAMTVGKEGARAHPKHTGPEKHGKKVWIRSALPVQILRTPDQFRKLNTSHYRSGYRCMFLAIALPPCQTC